MDVCWSITLSPLVNVIPSFRRFEFLSRKRNATIFEQMAQLMDAGDHLHKERIARLLF